MTSLSKHETVVEQYVSRGWRRDGFASFLRIELMLQLPGIASSEQASGCISFTEDFVGVELPTIPRDKLDVASRNSLKMLDLRLRKIYDKYGKREELEDEIGELLGDAFIPSYGCSPPRPDLFRFDRERNIVHIIEVADKNPLCSRRLADYYNLADRDSPWRYVIGEYLTRLDTIVPLHDDVEGPNLLFPHMLKVLREQW